MWAQRSVKIYRPPRTSELLQALLLDLEPLPELLEPDGRQHEYPLLPVEHSSGPVLGHRDTAIVLIELLLLLVHIHSSQTFSVFALISPD